MVFVRGALAVLLTFLISRAGAALLQSNPYSDLLHAYLCVCTGTVSQEDEVECLTACGSNGSILGVVNSVAECCVNMTGGAFNIPGAGQGIDCASCSDYQSQLLSHYHNIILASYVPSDIAGDIGFSFTPSNLMINDTLLAECIVVTQAGLSNPRADITWLGPDGTVFSSLQDVVFSEVTTAGIRQQEARLSLTFPRFSAADFGEYACIAAITSDSVPGAQTSVFRSVQIPSAPGKSPDIII